MLLHRTWLAKIRDTDEVYAQVAKNVVIGLLLGALWFDKGNLAKADFSYSGQQNSVQFINKSLAATQFTWDFGNGMTSEAPNPIHVFSASGNYLVKLLAKNDCRKDSLSSSITISPFTENQDIQQNQNFIFPNPSFDRLNFKIQNGISDIEVFDLTGKKLTNLEWDQNGLKTEKLTPGSYFILIHQVNTDRISSKFLKL
jgi:hypothetical protein